MRIAWPACGVAFARSPAQRRWRALLLMGGLVFAATVLFGALVLWFGGPIQQVVPHAYGGLTSERRLVGPIRVIDGDTIEAEGERIRIANIDTPEKPP